MKLIFLPFMALLFGAAPPAGSTLTLQIVDASGRPVENAVVTVKPDGGVPPGAGRYAGSTVMVQQNISFMPHVLIVPVGATVQFPNKDKVRHHVYSFSKPARFEMRLYSRDETRSYTFSSAGTVALGCNIHDAMSGFIKVVDTPWAAKSDAAGTATIGGVPSGNVTVTIWHERIRAADNEQSAKLAMPAADLGKRYTVTLR